MKKVMISALVVGLCFSASVMSQVPSYVPGNGLVGWWPFNGNAIDESGNGNNGTVNGATLIKDRFGNSNKAYCFDGNDNIKIDNSSRFAFGKKSASIGLWAKIYNNSSGYKNFVRYDDCMGKSGWGIRNNSGKINALAIKSPDVIDISSSTSYNDNSWHHILLNFDFFVNKIFLYVDGQIVSHAVIPENFEIIPNLNNVLSFGSCSGYEFFVGEMDDIGIWNRSLTSTEISKLIAGEELKKATDSNRQMDVKNNSQSITNTCVLIQQNTDFSSDKNPNLRKLKKMKGKVTKEEFLDYAIYFHDFLVPKNIRYYDDVRRGMGGSWPDVGESYPNQKIIEEKQTIIVKEQILPMAIEGNLKAISFLSGNGYWKSSQALNFISKNTSEISALKFMLFQLKFKEINNKANKYKLADDSQLKSYFLDFKKDDLLRVRELIEKKISEIKKITFGYDTYDYQRFPETRAAALSKLPSPIEDPSFCLTFDFAYFYQGIGSKLSIVPKSFDGSNFFYDAVDFLEMLKISIDFVLMNENPISLSQLLFDYKRNKMEGERIFDYMKPEDQYFANDKKWGPVIFKQLSGVIPYDSNETHIMQKSYYLNRAAELGATDAYINIACLYQVLYYRTNSMKYNDSCIHYIEKSINLNLPEAFALKGIKVFNGEGYIKNKEEGVRLLLKAKSLNSTTATTLLETYPKKYLEGLKEGYYFNESVKLNYPWNFKVLCSNNCGKYTYPKEIIFGRKYDDNQNMPQIKWAEFFIDDFGNPIINISYNDFRKTFSIAYMGFEYWKHIMCSATCQLAHENKNNKNFDAIKNKRNQIDNEIIKCVACKKSMKRRDMISISDCPCYTETGSSIGINLSQNYDIHGDSEPKACSYECQINFCKIKCNSKGYTSKY